MRQVPHPIHKCQAHGADLLPHRSEGGRGEGERERVGGPEAGGHDDEKDVAREMGVGETDDYGADGGDGEPGWWGGAKVGGELGFGLRGLGGR